MKATLERSPLNIYTYTHPTKLYEIHYFLNYIYILHNNNKIQNIFVYIQYTQTTKTRNIYKSTKIYKQLNLNNPRKSKKIFQNKKIKKIVGEQPTVTWCENGGGGHAIVLLVYALCVQYPFLPIVCAHKTFFLHWVVYLYGTNKIRS